MTVREDFLNRVIYQIYPRSFYDSDGDGIGDIVGITEKLGYLKELGVGAIWISPCYKSPKIDNGYDIADYRQIDSDYGTFDDFKKLVAEAHDKDIKILMDLVVNHTSSEHEWFKRAKKSKTDPYHDYYIWADKPLTVWTGDFGGSSWEYNADTDEYYYHSFAVQQPDLNWTNPKVRKECADIVDFWVNIGVDGFRCDVMDFIGKDFDENIRYGAPVMHGYLKEIFSRACVKNIFTVGECYSGEMENLCGKDRGELTAVFQFDHLGVGRQAGWIKQAFAYDDIKRFFKKWHEYSENNDLLHVLFTDNHDSPHFISRSGNDKELRYECATMFATMFYTVKGIPVIYEGQEYGSVSPKYDSIDCFNDISTLNYYADAEKNRKIRKEDLMAQINFGSRDNTRRPFCWNGNEKENFGFTCGKPWLALNSRGKEVNLESDLKSEKSVFNYYKKLLALRRNEKCIRLGRFNELYADDTDNTGFFVFEQSYENEKFVVICNFDRDSEINFPYDEKDFELVISNYGDRIGFSPIYRPFETAVYKLIINR